MVGHSRWRTYGEVRRAVVDFIEMFYNPDDATLPSAATDRLRTSVGTTLAYPVQARIRRPKRGNSILDDAMSADSLVKSRQRVADHGEVFTPAWLVEDMLNLVRHETERIDSRFLEPACGSGSFLVPILRRKLATVQLRYSKSDFERRHHALLGLMCIYGIELLADNAGECRQNLVDTFCEFLDIDPDDVWGRAAKSVVAVNIIQGDALAMKTATGKPITFPEWGYLGRGKFQRRDFRYESLTQMSSFGEDTLFGHMGHHEIFTPTKAYPPMTVEEVAG